MTEPPQQADSAIERNEEGDERLRALVKRALAADAVAKQPPNLLAGVQRRIRRRSRGKFFADGWSTSQARLGYVLIALATLLLVVATYFGLGPMAFR